VLQAGGFLIAALVLFVVLIAPLISAPVTGMAESGDLPNMMPVPKSPMG